jgi:FkbM family methyltransferase
MRIFANISEPKKRLSWFSGIVSRTIRSRRPKVDEFEILLRSMDAQLAALDQIQERLVQLDTRVGSLEEAQKDAKNASQQFLLPLRTVQICLERIEGHLKATEERQDSLEEVQRRFQTAVQQFSISIRAIQICLERVDTHLTVAADRQQGAQGRFERHFDTRVSSLEEAQRRFQTAVEQFLVPLRAIQICLERVHLHLGVAEERQDEARGRLEQHFDIRMESLGEIQKRIQTSIEHFLVPLRTVQICLERVDAHLGLAEQRQAEARGRLEQHFNTSVGSLRELQKHFQTAVKQFLVPLRTIQICLERFDARLEVAQDGQDEVRTHLEQHLGQAFQARFARLQIGLDAVRLDQKDGEAAARQELGRLPERLGSMIATSETATSVRGIASLLQHVDHRLDALNRLEMETEKAAAATQQELGHLPERLESIIAASETAAGVQEVRLLLQQVDNRLGVLDRLEREAEKASATTQQEFGILPERLGSMIAASETATNVRAITALLQQVNNRLSALDRLEIEAEKAATVAQHELGHLPERLGSMIAASETAASVREIASLLQQVDNQIGALGDTDWRNEFVAAAAHLNNKSDLLLQRAAIPLGTELLCRTSDGYLLAPAEDTRLLAAIYENGGRLEPGTLSILSSLLQADDWALDVGAHIGTTVLPAAQRVGPGGRIIAIEPGSRMRELLRRTIALNGLDDRVALHGCAAGAIEDLGRLNLGQTLGHSSLLPLEESESSEEVRIIPLDSLIDPGQRIRLAKIDTEGFELEVWRGMRRIVSENPELAVLVEFGPSHLRRAGTSIGDWLQEMLAPGFTPFEVNEDDGCLYPLRGIAGLDSVYSINLLLLRQPPTTLPMLKFA